MTDSEIEYLWGCKAIAGFIGRTARATYYLLESGELPAKRVGGRWVASRSRLQAFLTQVEAPL